MPFVKARPSEYLVVGRRGKIASRGQAASAFIWPGSTYVLVPSTQQEAPFEMTQESKDCIPLRFKGIVIYHIADAELAARQFDFAGQRGIEEINQLINHICLGELRATAAHLTMAECIEQRKTTLTSAVADALRPAIQGNAERPGWGIVVDVVQVAQVFIVDQELRRQLEAEVRNSIKLKSDLSDVQVRESVKRAEAASLRRLQQEQLDAEREKSSIDHEKLTLRQAYEQAEIESRHSTKLKNDLADLQMRENVQSAEAAMQRRLQQDQLESERAKTAIEQEKLALKNAYERAQIEANHPLEELRIDKETQRLQMLLDKRVLENRFEELKVQAAMVGELARHNLRKEILPLEQLPAVAEAVRGMFQGMHLNVVGQELPLFATLLPLLDLVSQKLRTGQAPAQ
jgi:hypothetical protein